MNEEEIIKYVNEIIKDSQNEIKGKDYFEYIMTPNDIKAIQGLLDLYQKEKEKNKWKPITEYNREKYDWVLVKYYDGDYECVPEVAEQRSDGKWYTSEREIPFEVKYFFDIQELLEERN